MRRFILLLSTFFLLSCKKNVTTKYNNGIVGKWKLVGSKIGIGSNGNYVNVDSNSIEIIEFKSDGIFANSSSQIFLSDFTLYEIVDSTQINFSPNPYSITMYYSLLENNSRLHLKPLCYEGCLYDYIATE